MGVIYIGTPIVLVAQLCSILCDPMDWRMPGFPDTSGRQLKGRGIQDGEEAAGDGPGP